uniref:Uncharacterized protein n=1 Tax=Anguilla anguilla TaxID=7936 RepID=A0A0E9QKZ6_ANGAN
MLCTVRHTANWTSCQLKSLPPGVTLWLITQGPLGAASHNSSDLN